MAAEPPDERRRRAFGLGLQAEAWSVLWLRAKGYRILARRFRCRAGEIDIVAARGSVLAIVEVKARPSRTAALAAVTPVQRRRVERAALAFLAGRPPGALPGTLRFDVMLVSPWRLPSHIPNAWQAELGSRSLGAW